MKIKYRNEHIDVKERVQIEFLRYLEFKTATPITNHDYVQNAILKYKKTSADLCMVHKILNGNVDFTLFPKKASKYLDRTQGVKICLRPISTEPT